MNLANLLEHLMETGARVQIRDGTLHLSAPETMASPDWLKQARDVRDELFAFVQQHGGHFQAAPLTRGQAALWSLYQLQPDSPVYNLTIVFRLRQDLQIHFLEQSLTELVARHETLRTRIETINERTVQVIHPAGALPFRLEKAPDWSEEQTKAWIDDLSRQPFRLEEEPWARACLLQRTGVVGENLLVMTFHHIISDFLTFGVVRDELDMLYRHFAAAGPAPRPVTTQFRHCAIREAWWLESLEGIAALDFWKKKLSGEYPLLELPTDRPRPPVQSFRGARSPFQIEAQTGRRIREQAAQLGVTPYLYMLTVFQILLRRYCGQDQFHLGTFISGREHIASQQVLGYLAAPLVLQADTSEDPGFKQLTQRVQGIALEAFQHQDYPFALLVEKLGIRRDPRFSPVFQVVFLWEFAQWLHEGDEQGLVRDIVLTDQGGAPFDLIFSVSDEGDQGFSGTWLYNPDIFDGQTIERIHQHYLNLLAAVATHPDMALSRLPILDPEEEMRVRQDWNQTEQQFPTGVCLQEMVLQQAARTPHAAAVIQGGREYRYCQIVHHAVQLARQLREAGAEPEKLVAVVAEKGWQQVVAVLGIQIAGAAYLPLDPSWPKARRAQIIDQGKVSLVVADTVSGHAGNHPEHVAIIEIDDEPVAPDSAQPEYPAAIQSPDQLAYVIFTSGSSGRPKGVAIEHAAAANTLFDINRRHHIGHQDRVLGLSSLGFDLSVYDIFGMLAVGGAVVLPLPEEAREPAAWARLLKEHRITFWNTVPALMQLLVSHCELADHDALNTIKTVMMSGDWIPVDLPDRIRALSPQTLVFSYGGATEASIWSISHPIGAVNPDLPSIPYGKAMANQSFFVLDQHLEPCPVGVAGDLYIGGVGLARCYFGDEEKTAAAFIQHPRWEERLYRTGDLGRYFANGDIEFLGRADFQVKVNGYRIELAEIESVLLQKEVVRETAVIVGVKPNGNKHLVAYIVSGDASADTEALKAHVGEKLPEYMVPDVFVFLESMPLTANGKVDRKALPNPETSPETSDGDAPQTPVESLLAQLWQDVLGVPRVGRDDNYFELGGDSITSIQIISRAAQQGLRLTTRLLFQHASVAALAQHVTMVDKVEAASFTGDVPITPIWSWFCRTRPQKPQYFNQSLLLHLPSGTTLETLSEVLAHLVTSHDSLRMVCPSGLETREVKETCNPVRIDELACEDLSEARTRLQQCATADDGGIDLVNGPLIRAVVARVADSEADCLLLVAHHNAVDGVSWRIMLEDLEALLEAHQTGKRPVLRRTTSFGVWAERLKQAAQSNAITASEAYWRDTLVSAGKATRARDLAFDSQGENLHGHAQNLVYRLAPELSQQLLDGAGSWRLKVDELLLTALLETFGMRTGNYALALDLEGHGREELFDDVDLSRTVGWFTSMYPVTLAVDTEAPESRKLETVKAILRRIPDKGMGFGLLHYLNMDVDLDTTNSPDIVFNYLGNMDRILPPDSKLELPANPLSAQAALENGRGHLLEINVASDAEGLAIHLGYSSACHREQEMNELGQSFLIQIERFVNACRQQDDIALTVDDFPDVALSREQLADVLERAASDGVEDIRPITGQQFGVLYHRLISPESDAYTVHLSFDSDRGLNVEAWQAAWDAVVARHEVFRTFFVALEEEQPLQVICKKAQISWQILDFTGLEVEVCEQRIKDLMMEDRRQGFAFERAPLSRMYLIRTGAEACRFIWSHHHVLCDGWSFAIILGDLFRSYEAALAGTTAAFEPAGDVRPLELMRRKGDSESDKTWWRNYLEGFTKTTPLASQWDRENHETPGQSFQVETGLEKETAATLNQLVAQQGITAHVLLSACWGLMLHHLSKQDDVVFGVTVSGRPPEMAGVENMVGLFINSVPNRIRIRRDAALIDWLKDLYDVQLPPESRTLMPLASIQQTCKLAAGEKLFDSLLVVENYPIGEAFRDTIKRHAIKNLGVNTRNSFPLTLNATPAEDFSLKVMVNDTRINRKRATEIGSYCRLLLEQMALNPHITLAALVEQLEMFDATSRQSEQEAALAMSAGKLRTAGRRRARSRK